jgi:hypothetical protein
MRGLGYGNDSVQNGPFGFQRAEAVCFRVVAAVGLGRFSIEVECVIAEAIDVLREVWTDGCDGVFGDGFSRCSIV